MEYTYLGGTPPPIVTDHLLSWKVDSLGDGADTTFLITMIVNEDGNYNNQARATALNAEEVFAAVIDGQDIVVGRPPILTCPTDTIVECGLAAE